MHLGGLDSLGELHSLMHRNEPMLGSFSKRVLRTCGVAGRVRGPRVCFFLEKDESFNLIFLHFCTNRRRLVVVVMVQSKVGRGVPECYTQLSSKRGGEKPAKFTRCT